MKFGDIFRTIPTNGFNMEIVTYKKTKLNQWDLVGQKYVWLWWRNYFHATQGQSYIQINSVLILNRLDNWKKYKL